MIIVEFINLKLVLIQLQICFCQGNVLLIQSNHHSFLAVSSLPALRLLCCCLVAEGWRCCNCRLWVLMLPTTEQGGRGVGMGQRYVILVTNK